MVSYSLYDFLSLPEEMICGIKFSIEDEKRSHGDAVLKIACTLRNCLGVCQDNKFWGRCARGQRVLYLNDALKLAKFIFKIILLRVVL